MCGAYYSLDFFERGLELFAARLSGSLAAVDEAKAVPLVAERLSLPARGAVVRLVDVLPGRLAVMLAGGRDMVRPRGLRSRARRSSCRATRSGQQW